MTSLVRRLRSRKGQVSIMIAMMTLTFGFFFIFVVATGALVSAKINLQNAADLAAYAGAAVQARHLNHISFLNYEMRRQYKKFLFRYYIVGTKAYKDQVGGGQRMWALNGTSQSDLGVPSVCVTFNQKSNHCQVAHLRPIKAPPANMLDSVSVALAEQLKALEQIRRKQCGMTWYTNEQLLFLWLFNTDPTLEILKTQLAAGGPTSGTSDENAQTRAVLETIQNLAQGLGLIPKLALLSQRIETLQGFMNEPAATGLNFDGAQQMKAAVNTPIKERTIQAFFSAFYTLGSGEKNDSFPGDKIEMTELLPTQLLGLNKFEVDFAAYWTYFQPKEGSDPSSPITGDEGQCNPFPCRFALKKVPMGYYKDPKILTYYAVRLDADANVLFRKKMFPGLALRLRLRAYAAAQPFGSRIGPWPPHLAASDFTKVAEPQFPAVFGASSLVPLSFPVPNLRLAGSGGAGGGAGDYWDMNVYRALQGRIPVPGGRIDLSDPDIYYDVMAPNPPEKGKYNILNDFALHGGAAANRRNALAQYFPTSKVDSPVGEPVYSFYAPIIPPNTSPAEAAKKIVLMINRSIGNVQATWCPADTKVGELKDSLIVGLTEYMKRMALGGGEDGEGNLIARVRNPFKGKSSGAGWTDIRGITPYSLGEVGANFPQTLNNSWTTKNDKGIGDNGRLGYSVKFISFKSLMSGGGSGLTSNGQDGWDNYSPNVDGDTAADLPNLEH